MGSIRCLRLAAALAVSAAAAFAVLSGCKKEEGKVGGSTTYDFIHRACGELHAYSYLLGSSVDPNTGDMSYWRERLPETSLPASSYVLELLIGADLDTFECPDRGNVLPPDVLVENQIEKRYFGRNKTKSHESVENYYEFLRIVEYRTEVAEDIRVYADKDISGRAAGTDIGDLFEIILLSGRNNGFMISESGRYLGEIEQGTSISDYLRRRPMIAASMALHLKSVPSELPQTLAFSIDVTMSSGVTISSSTAEISLMQ